MSFSYENRLRAQELIDRYPVARSALLPLLHLAQAQDGCVTDEAMREIAGMLGISPAEVLSTASFYTMFKIGRAGGKLVSVCTNISCMLMGGEELLEQLEGELGVERGTISADGEIELEEVECLAACGGAPCIQVDYEYFENMTPERTSEMAAALERGEHPEGGGGLPVAGEAVPGGAGSSAAPGGGPGGPGGAVDA